MEKDWREEIDDVCIRWYDERDIVRKAVYPNNKGTFYYDGNARHHRLDGPAREWAAGKEWYIHGERIFCSSQEEFERLMKLKAFW
jgi:hypothetical protein